MTEALDGLLEERGLDWSSAVIGGFSQGTVMSYAVALGEGRPEPAGLLAMSGFIPEVDGWSADLASRRPAVYIHHGANDPVITVDFARAANERLVAAGLEPAYRETTAGHWLPPEIVAEVREFVAATLSAPQAP